MIVENKPVGEGPGGATDGAHCACWVSRVGTGGPHYQVSHSKMALISPSLLHRRSEPLEVDFFRFFVFLGFCFITWSPCRN